MAADKLQHISEEVEREVTKLRDGGRDWQLEQAITAAKGTTMDDGYDSIDREIAEQDKRVAKLIATAESALKECSSRMFADAEQLHAARERQGRSR
jgi:hypothetical protein